MNASVKHAELTKAGRRGRHELRFASLGDVMPEVERVLLGHVVVGRWSLGVICRHLRVGFEMSMDGFPERGPWVVRRTVGPVARWWVLWRGWMPRGMPVPGWRAPVEELDAGREAEGLREAIARFEAFGGELDEHPMLGRFSREAWRRFHCVHCAHHLRFVVPAADEQHGYRQD